MRSSSARPTPRSTATAPIGPHNNRPTPLPRQNGGGAVRQQTQQQGRDMSRSRSAALQNGVGRSPSVPPPQMTTPRFVNRRYAHVKSKVGSITDHSPAPSAVKIFHQPLKVSAAPKVGSLQNASHVPAGGNVRIENRKLTFRESARPKVDAKSEVPLEKSEKKIPTQKLVWKAESKVGSLENAAHKPGGGQIKIFNDPVNVKAAESKVGSLDNMGHVPGGGNVKISDYSRSISGAGSVPRSRRDTGDSGRSSSLASGAAGAGQQQQKPRPALASTTMAQNREENGTQMGRDQQQPLEIVMTPRHLPEAQEEPRRYWPQQQNHHESVAEGQLISFGEENHNQQQ